MELALETLHLLLLLLLFLQRNSARMHMNTDMKYNGNPQESSGLLDNTLRIMNLKLTVTADSKEKANHNIVAHGLELLKLKYIRMYHL